VLRALLLTAGFIMALVAVFGMGVGMAACAAAAIAIPR